MGEHAAAGGARQCRARQQGQYGGDAGEAPPPGCVHQLARRASVRPSATRPANRPMIASTSAIVACVAAAAPDSASATTSAVAGNWTGNWPAGELLDLAERLGPGGERLVERLALDLAEDPERVRPGGGREEDGLVGAGLAEDAG